MARICAARNNTSMVHLREAFVLACGLLSFCHGAVMSETFQPLFDGTPESFKRWRQVGPNSFTVSHGTLVTSGTVEFGLLYYTRATFADFIMRLEFSLTDPSADNSGVFVRFRDPLLPPTAAISARDKFNDTARNKAWIAAYSGFEAQIDECARGDKKIGEPDGLDKNRTGAIYKIPTGQQGEPRLQAFEPAEPLRAHEWNRYEIEVVGDSYRVRLNGQQTTRFINTDPERGRSPKIDPTFGYVGIQSYAGSRVAFRDIIMILLPSES